MKYRKRSTKRKTISPKLEEKQKKVRDILKIGVWRFDYQLDRLSHQLISFKRFHFETDQTSLIFLNYFLTQSLLTVAVFMNDFDRGLFLSISNK